MKTATYSNECDSRYSATVKVEGSKVSLFLSAPHIKGTGEVGITNTELAAAYREATRKAKNFVGL